MTRRDLLVVGFFLTGCCPYSDLEARYVVTDSSLECLAGAIVSTSEEILSVSYRCNGNEYLVEYKIESLVE